MSGHEHDEDGYTGAATLVLGETELDIEVELRGHFQLEKTVRVHEGQELIEPPDSIRKQLEIGAEGMESLGQVYRDAETGKLILVGQ